MEIKQEIKPELIDFIFECIDSKLQKGKIVIDGNILIKDVYRTITKNGVMRKYIYLDTEFGFISHAALIDSQGKEFYAKNPDYLKSSQQGHVIAFPIKIEVV